MRTKTVRILNIVAGILLIAAGIYCLCNEDVAVLSAGLMLGIFMLAAGIAEIVVFEGSIHCQQHIEQRNIAFRIFFGEHNIILSQMIAPNRID